MPKTQFNLIQSSTAHHTTLPYTPFHSPTLARSPALPPFVPNEPPIHIPNISPASPPFPEHYPSSIPGFFPML
ncbi:unnamed protein product [Periconia digitata]|uniref:Uncharacterized protein n=1 Tax=Periconia digitata TaxID=1303443 RepID=A0A9W4XWH1_9PLEO|nr:unnamed protein product [Periconia digitata]